MRTSRVGRTRVLVTAGSPATRNRHSQEPRNLAKIPDFSESEGRMSVAPSIRERRRPSHAVHVAMKSSINDTNVIQKPVIHKLAVPREEKERSYLARQ